jgi:putative peptide zinc metalloprotease protein
MTATAEPPVSTVERQTAIQARRRPPLARGEGIELLGDVHGCGYRDGACLVRRADGQMLQLGRLMYTLLECIDGRRDTRQLAVALGERLERQVDEEHIVRLAQKLARQGLLRGTEQHAPPRRNPLLALRWKVLVTNPEVTRRLTAPFTVLFRTWLVAPVIACFGAVFWFVLMHKGVASATTEAFHRPGLLVLVFGLGVVSAGFHELGHAAAARYAGATPGGMGMGLYLVWPAFYTDVTDAYRLPKRDRLRIDLAGLYFNAVVAVITMAVWLAVHADALLLLVALQVLQMVKQLSPVIRADGYHILSDATGVPDLYAHIVPTLRRVLPGHRREPSALTGRARLLVTVWVLVVVPVLLALILGAVLLFPRLATTAWDSGRHIAQAVPHQADHGQVLDLLASLLSLLALVLPVAGSALVTQKIVRTTSGKAWGWSRRNPARRTLVLIAGAAALAGIAWAWWPSGQYQPIRANRGGTLGGLVRLVAAPGPVARPGPSGTPLGLAPGTHLAVAMIPVDGATKRHPALFIIPRRQRTPVALLSSSTPKPPSRTNPTTTIPTSTAATGTTGASTANSVTATPPSNGGATATSTTTQATAFPFKLPAPPGRGGTQALAVGTKNGGVTYDIAYALVTVRHGAPVTNTNSAYALADCNACTTVAVSFQVILVIGQSRDIAPINAAEALNYDCPACVTTAIADQIVVTLGSRPSRQLLSELNADLSQLNALPELGSSGTPDAVASQVATVQQEIDSQLAASGLLTNPPASSSTTSTPSGSTSSSPAGGASAGASTSSGAPTASSSNQTTTPSTSTSTTPTTTSPTPSTTTTTPTTTSPTPSTTTTTTPTTTSPTSSPSG